MANGQVQVLMFPQKQVGQTMQLNIMQPSMRGARYDIVASRRHGHQGQKPLVIDSGSNSVHTDHRPVRAHVSSQ